MNYKLTLVILLVLFMTPFIFSDLALSTDDSLSTFYISNNSSKDISFNLTSDYSGSLGNNLRAEYTLESFSSLNNIEVSLSKKEEYFISNVNSTVSLNVRSYKFNNQKIKLKIKVFLFDGYNNLLDSSYLYIDLISNNSEYDFLGMPKNKVPEYKGYSLSKDKLLILNQFDNDKLIITNHIDNSISYGTNCSVNKNGLIIDLRYIGNNQYSLEASIDQNTSVEKNIFSINCVSYYREDKHSIKAIDVIYLNQDINAQTDLIVDDEINTKNSVKGFFNNIFNKLKK